MAMEKILVPLDGSDLAEAALETAIDILRERPEATPAGSRPLTLGRGAGRTPQAGEIR